MPKKPRPTASKSLLRKSASQHVHGKAGKSINLVGLISEKKRATKSRPSTVKIVEADQQSLRELDIIMATADSVIVVEGKHQTEVSGKPFRMMKHVLHALGSTEDDTDAELTSQEAADLLNVSRPYVIKLAREKTLPCFMVGNRHRFMLSDVLAFQEKQAAERDKALRAIAPKGGYTAEDF